MLEKPPKLRLERFKPPPSERNQRIFVEVRVQGQSQAEVAQRYAMTQGRVSAICRQIDRWNLWANSPQGDAMHKAQQRRMTLLHHRDRCEQIYLAAVHQIVQQSDELVTEHTSNRSGRSVSERTVRQVPVSVQWLKVAHKASRDIARLNEKLGSDVRPSLIGQRLDRLLFDYLAGSLAEKGWMLDDEGRTTASPGGSPACSDEPGGPGTLGCINSNNDYGFTTASPPVGQPVVKQASRAVSGLEFRS